MKNEFNKDDLLRSLMDDGQRAYRLRKSIGDCPNFELDSYKSAWKAGYYTARSRVSLDVCFTTWKKEHK
jgi:hypothetical protein